MIRVDGVCRTEKEFVAGSDNDCGYGRGLK